MRRHAAPAPVDREVHGAPVHHDHSPGHERDDGAPAPPQSKRPAEKTPGHRKGAVHAKRGPQGAAQAAWSPKPGSLPLTGTLAPGGKVPGGRVASKLRTCPSRPQWGLDKADIVFEEPVEGGITRSSPSTSARRRRVSSRCGRAAWSTPDPRTTGPDPFRLLGAIQPAINEIDSKTSLLEDVGRTSSERVLADPDRYAPTTW